MGVARHVIGSRTAIVTREVAHSLPSSLRISTSHSHVVRPRWNARGLGVHRARAHRPQEARVVRHPERHLAQLEHAVGGTPRRERLGDRGVHTAVHDPHRLAHAGRTGSRAVRTPDLDEVVELESDHGVERVLEREPPVSPAPKFVRWSRGR